MSVDDFYEVILTIALSSARIMPVFIMLPFLNSNVINNTIRVPVVMLVGMALSPYGYTLAFDLSLLQKFGLIIKELFVGLLLGCLICTPFWIIHAAGCIIDNQRGATISSSIDPVSGVDTSELANFFNLFCAVIFLSRGGLTLMLEVIHKSYELLGPSEYRLPSLTLLFPLLGFIVMQAVRIASPLITVFLLTEAILGLLSRFAPQMNAFSLSLTVKSFIGFLMLILYFPASLTEIVRSLIFISSKLIL
ncbi:type III secretion system export apparatus subunit SctT [Rouxiella chamberiensis]|uniref:Type III secretion system export apparatus subunit SctT n=1 Tax=Rouxiella chamberiensis TaxID=1513468 RepID=A0ABY7HUN3_9GAMM|nr:type III secretion system export apparatus subunit SctT [Rouxiella chamberiensis]WAT02667.1 type III secretion system export apparatus subunit SctT [Rouxiella chamberiensis]